MVWVLFVAHLLAIPVVVLAGRRSMQAGLVAGALAPLVTSVWASVELVAGGDPVTAELVWVDGLDVAIALRADALGLLMTLLVSGMGALVMVYACGYFSADAVGGTRFPATLLAFSTSMLGLVWADSIWTLFIFWELTSVTSFLLVGHKHVDSAVRMAARRALVITAGGGLVLLAGLIMLAEQAGSPSLTAIVPIAGTQATAAAVLLLIGAATKSAQIPFHVWLPGAMAAPTPVSAYLHSAAMVKAGILLVAVLGPAFGDVATWKWLGIALGSASVIWGAVGALRHCDAKLILAWGTVSQLGLMLTLLAVGTPKAIFAAIALLFSHALFKAALFLVVGEVDVRTGTRDITQLGGLARSMPVAFAVALLAGASMVGLPPLVGFTAKEAAIEAVLKLSGTAQALVGVAIIGGSILTVAYTVRLLHGVFGPGPATSVDTATSADTSINTSVKTSANTSSALAPRKLLMELPALLLGMAGVAGYAAIGVVNHIVGTAASELNRKAAVYELIMWPGLKAAFVISVLVVIAGALLGALLVLRGPRRIPSSVGANTVDGIVDGVIANSPRLIAAIQHGSLPVYLAVMAAVAVLAAAVLSSDFASGHLVWWDHPIQGALALTVVVAALAAAFVGSRLGAALALGSVGFGVTGLFLVHGAPDLALTQLLVETVVVVGFVLGLGHLARRFPPIRGSWRSVRMTVAAAGGLAVTAALAAAGANPTDRAPTEALVAGAVDEGGGNNVVNVILTDIRALDTLGEVVVLATVAIGILALARVRSYGASQA
ncbi:MAG: DUF4040 domain-containing protein [Acidimicrobiia bacterium]|nr:DUF4040 domain-containing protein [Acidimicrobiia bacterium]MYC57322.1 DUF4040 domain-containing protein [Acidimicrobiia bacterium]MYI31023.1 DUF4040 domain-containing protein [Acidimicrobiia bacterium]